MRFLPVEVFGLDGWGALNSLSRFTRKEHRCQAARITLLRWQERASHIETYVWLRLVLTLDQWQNRFNEVA
jgi:hypothetical protein